MTPQKVKLSLIQCDFERSVEKNVQKAIDLVKEAAQKGAQIILLPELFENHYFCQIETEEHFSWAHPVEGHPFLGQFQGLARSLGVVLPISFFEKAGQAHYNSLAMIDADGSLLGVYRKSHIPDGPGYEEKYYFNPGDTGFCTWKTRFGNIGVGICWDQWYPECARVMALLGADLLLYPTAIGTEPEGVVSPNSASMWQKVMVGHAIANSCYVAAANRVGHEAFSFAGREHTCDFYGSSFVCGYDGDFLAQAGTSESTLLFADLDFASAQKFRAGMGFFRDRRPQLYGPLLTMDGRTSRV